MSLSGSYLYSVLAQHKSSNFYELRFVNTGAAESILCSLALIVIWELLLRSGQTEFIDPVMLPQFSYLEFNPRDDDFTADAESLRLLAGAFPPSDLSMLSSWGKHRMIIAMLPIFPGSNINF